MTCFIKAHDFEDALPRRLEVREKHLENLRALKAQGKLIHASALLDGKGDPCGTVMIVDLTEDETRALFSGEPYIQNRVWDPARITITPCRPAPI